MTVVKIKKYRGASILVLNEWQSFIYAIYYRGQFYANEINIHKSGEYSNSEYLRAMDGALIAAKSTIDIIKGREFPYNLIKKCQDYLQISKEPKVTTK